MVPRGPVAPSLTQLYFYLTEGCNLACRHCWLAPKYDPQGDRYSSLPVELFETAIQEAKAIGLQRVKLTGGEPLLHPQIQRLLQIVRREGVGLVMETNGVLMTADLAAQIASCSAPFVSVSLDGADAETHEWVRGVSGCFEATKSGIRNLVETGIRPQVIMSLFRENVDQVEALVRLAQRLGASSVKFNVIQPTARGEQLHKASSTLGVGELIELGRWVDLELSRTTELSLYFDYPLAFRPLSRIASADGCGICGIFNILGVLSSGHYALCGIGEHLPEFVFGKVGRDPLAKVWIENDRLNEIRSSLPDRLGGVCAVCLMKVRCLGSCIAQNIYRGSELSSPYWFCQAAFEVGAFPPSRINEARAVDQFQSMQNASMEM
jgi:SynChlorMet cassette radical SAM/SPASM protein ScmF